MLLVMATLTACQQQEKRFREAENLLQVGLEQRADKRSEAAAESFSQALLAIERCDAIYAELHFGLDEEMENGFVVYPNPANVKIEMIF